VYVGSIVRGFDCLKLDIFLLHIRQDHGLLMVNIYNRIGGPAVLVLIRLPWRQELRFTGSKK